MNVKLVLHIHISLLMRVHCRPVGQ